jgi:hypothetical protein
MALTDLESIFTEGQFWPPASERDRLKKYNENSHLRLNQFNEVWRDYQRLIREDARQDFRIILGYFKTSTTKKLDILLGKPPLISSASQSEQETRVINDLVEFTDLYQVIYEVAFDLDSLGDAFYKIYLDKEGKAVIQSNNPACVIIIVQPGNLRKVQYYIIWSIFEQQDKQAGTKNNYLAVEIHSKDRIEYRVYEISPSILHDGTRTIRKRQSDLAPFAEDFPQSAGENVGEDGTEENPVGDFLVIHVPGIRSSCAVYGESGYGEDLKSLWKAIIRRYTGIDVVLGKHEDPNLIAPIGYTERDPVTQKQVFRGGGRIFLYRHDPGMNAPDIRYLTWDGNLDPGERSIDRLQKDFWNAAEVPPASLGAYNVGGAVTGIAYRLMMTPLLAACNRLEMSLRPRLQKAIRIALKLQGVEITELKVKFHENMPRIPLEEAQRLGILAEMPQFQGEVGSQWILEQLEIPPEKATEIITDPSREGGLGTRV